jgi:rhamnosyltransferase
MQEVREPGDEGVLASIIVLTKNGERHLRSVLEALYRQRLIGAAEVIVIDSGSSDATLAIAAAFPVQLTRIAPEEFGHGRTRNLGARLARGRFLVFLPQDATPLGAGWLEALLRPFDDPAVAGTYGRQIARPDASPMEAFFLEWTYPPRPETRRADPASGVSLAQCFFSTVGGAIRASLWKDHPFDETVIMSEDQAWSKEIMQAGHAIAYQPAAEMLHSHAYGIAGIFRRNFDSGFSVRQIFAGNTGISFGRACANLAREARFVARSGRFGDLLRFPFYEAARHLGFWLGMHAERLPLRMRKACGNLGYFWDRVAGAGR